MKKFLKAFATVAAGFAASQSANAAIPETATDSLATKNILGADAVKPSDTLEVRNGAGDMFSFVMKRSAETGQLMAYHRSHASHASHRSHYSSRY